MTRTTLIVALVAGLLTASGCSSSSTGSSYDLVEFAIDGPTQLAPGNHSLEVSNSGEFPHTLVVTDASGAVVAATDLVQSGESTQLPVDLQTGRYSFTCRIVAQTPNGDIADHFEAGMSTTVTVEG
jgi:uncharacterized cupredoxin-like copper-binding protein